MSLIIPSMSEIRWIHVDEDLPKKSGYLSTWNGNKRQVCYFKNISIGSKKCGVFFSRNLENAVKVTHWLKLVEVPKGKTLVHGFCGGDLETVMSPAGIYRCVKCNFYLGK